MSLQKKMSNDLANASNDLANAFSIGIYEYLAKLYIMCIQSTRAIGVPNVENIYIHAKSSQKN